MKRCNDGKKISGLFVRMRDMMEWRRRITKCGGGCSRGHTSRHGGPPLLELADGGLTNKGIRWLVVRRRLSTFDDIRCFCILRYYGECAVQTHL